MTDPIDSDANRQRRRRELLRGLAALSGAALLPAARAQGSYPDKPIRLIVPFPPGGLTDTLGRMVAERLRQSLGQTVVVENRPGAGTLLAGRAVATSPPDGYTLMIATSTTLGISPALFANPPMQIDDLVGVAMLGNVTLLLATRPDFPAKSLPELVAALRAKPGGYNYGSPGNGTVHHLLIEMLKTQERLFATHIPYQGSAQAMTDLIAGRIDFMLIDAAIALPQVRAGNLKVLAVAGTGRTPVLPDVPAIVEIFPKIDLYAWQSVAAPRGTPAAIVERLNAEVNKALATPQFREQLVNVGLEARSMPVAEFNEMIRRDASRWAALVKQSGAKVD